MRVIPDDAPVIRVSELRAMVEKEGLSLRAAAKRTGLSASYISRILNGDRVKPFRG
jgi:transcriptional regulator with XRE-family HTH domain